MKARFSYMIIIPALLMTVLVSCHPGNDKAANEPATTSNDENLRSAAPDTTKVTIPASDTTTAATRSHKKAKKGKVSSVMSTGAEATEAEIFPLFPGGQAGLDKFLAENVVYPQDALDEGIEGTVVVEFAVDKKGMIYTPHFISKKLGYGLEVEAMRVINKMPLWTPGSIKGKNITTQYRLPIKFQLAE